MMLLITSDLHLTDRPRDNYRFKLFPWLAKQQEKYKPRATFILGDITDKKDNHSSILVNQLVDAITALKPPIYVLKGNHDFVDTENPFFRFLNQMEGLHFVTKHQEIWPGLHMIPHCGTQAEFNAICGKIAPKPDTLMLHATIEGSIAESGSRLSGLSASPIELLRPGATWAGDVHKPQRVGPVTYIGAPYTVRFGDNFTPRVLLVTGSEGKNLYFDCLRKWALTVHDEVDLQRNKDLRAGDQVKLTIEMTREEVVEWHDHKQRVLAACKELGLDVFGVELKLPKRRERVKLQAPTEDRGHETVVADYCKSENLPNAVKQVGLEIIEIRVK